MNHRSVLIIIISLMLASQVHSAVSGNPATVLKPAKVVAPGIAKTQAKKAKPIPTATSTATATPPAVTADGNISLYNYDASWGREGTGPGQFRSPEGIEIADDGEIFIADSGNNRIVVLDEKGTFSRSFGAFGPTSTWRNPPQFNRPTGLEVLPDKKLYVADTLNHRIVVVDARGLVISTWGNRGTGEGEFDRPRDVVLDHYGNVRVLDSGNSRMQIFSGLGAFKDQWGSFGKEAGQMKYPLGFDLNIIDQSCISDTENFRYQVFNSDGTPVTAFGWYGDGPGQFKEPGGVAITPSGLIAIADGVKGRLVILNNRWEPLGTWVGADQVPNLKNPPQYRGVASDSTGRLYVTDIANHMIVRLKPTKAQGNVDTSWPTPTPVDNGLYGGPGYPVR